MPPWHRSDFATHGLRSEHASTELLVSKTHKVVIAIAVVLGLLTIGSLPFFSRDRVKNETIEASAKGTGTQLGAVVGVSMEIYDGRGL